MECFSSEDAAYQAPVFRPKTRPKYDHIAELFALLREAGARPTLHGKPVTEGELRAVALERALERVEGRGNP